MGLSRTVSETDGDFSKVIFEIFDFFEVEYLKNIIAIYLGNGTR